MKRAALLNKMVLALVATGMFVSASQADVTARFSRGTLTLTGDSFGDLSKSMEEAVEQRC